MDGREPSLLQGATVLHRLACLYEIVIQDATKGATMRYTGWYIFKTTGKSPLVTNHIWECLRIEDENI